MTSPNLAKVQCPLCGKVPRNIVRPDHPFRTCVDNNENYTVAFGPTFPAKTPICSGHFIEMRDPAREGVIILQRVGFLEKEPTGGKPQ